MDSFDSSSHHFRSCNVVFTVFVLHCGGEILQNLQYMLYIFTYYVVTCKRVLSWTHILWFRGAFVWVSLYLLEIGIKSAGLHGLRCGITKISLGFFVLLKHSGPVTLQLVWQWREAWLHITEVSQRQTAVHFPLGWCSPHITHSGEEYSSTSPRHAARPSQALALIKKSIDSKMIKKLATSAGARITALPSDLFHCRDEVWPLHH